MPEKVAAVYCRVSTQEQAEIEDDDGKKDPKESLKRQVEDCLEYCKRHDYTPLEPYIDIQSGADLEKERANFQRLMADIRGGIVDVVIIWAGDRLSRAMRPTIEFRDALDAAEIEIEGVTEPLGRDWLAMRALFAEQWLEMHRQRIRMGKRGMARQGKYPCGIAPYGYRYDKKTKKLVVEPSEAAVVQKVYDLYLDEGLSFRGICRRLNDEKVPTRGAGTRSDNHERKGWVIAVVGRVLTNPTYKGTWEYARTRHGKDGKKRDADEADYLDVEVPAIVSEAQWEQAQKKAERNKHHAKGHDSTLFYQLRGHLYCDECGQRFKSMGTPAGTVKKGRGGKPYTVRSEHRAYGCQGQEKHPHLHQCRKPWSIQAERLEEPVWEKVTEMLRDPSGLERAAKSHLKAWEQPADGFIAKRRKVLDEATRERETIVHEIGKGNLKVDECRSTLDRLDGTIRMCEDELARLSKQAKRQAERDETMDYLRTFCKDIGPTLDAFTPVQRRELYELLELKAFVDDAGAVRLEGSVTAPREAPLKYQERRR